jgi:hypothetical protein
MNSESQHRKILAFLGGKFKKDIDAFCIYQWVERCHNEEWWDLGIQLAGHIPSNSMDQQYHKRLYFLLSECRINRKEPAKIYLRKESQNARFKYPGDTHHPLSQLNFQNPSKETLTQIYSVLYFMIRNEQDFPDAVRSTMRALKVKHYQTVCDKCARRFAGTVYEFKRLRFNGGLLNELNDKFAFSSEDYLIFRNLLNTENE